jgi:hypothetical protein
MIETRNCRREGIDRRWKVCAPPKRVSVSDDGRDWHSRLSVRVLSCRLPSWLADPCRGGVPAAWAQIAVFRSQDKSSVEVVRVVKRSNTASEVAEC